MKHSLRTLKAETKLSIKSLTSSNVNLHLLPDSYRSHINHNSPQSRPLLRELLQLNNNQRYSTTEEGIHLTSIKRGQTFAFIQWMVKLVIHTSITLLKDRLELAAYNRVAHKYRQQLHYFKRNPHLIWEVVVITILRLNCTWIIIITKLVEITSLHRLLFSKWS